MRRRALRPSFVVTFALGAAAIAGRCGGSTITVTHHLLRPTAEATADRRRRVPRRPARHGRAVRRVVLGVVHLRLVLRVSYYVCGVPAGDMQRVHRLVQSSAAGLRRRRRRRLRELPHQALGEPGRPPGRRDVRTDSTNVPPPTGTAARLRARRTPTAGPARCTAGAAAASAMSTSASPTPTARAGRPARAPTSRSATRCTPTPASRRNVASTRTAAPARCARAPSRTCAAAVARSSRAVPRRTSAASTRTAARARPRVATRRQSVTGSAPPRARSAGKHSEAVSYLDRRVERIAQIGVLAAMPRHMSISVGRRLAALVAAEALTAGMFLIIAFVAFGRLSDDVSFMNRFVLTPVEALANAMADAAQLETMIRG